MPDYIEKRTTSQIKAKKSKYFPFKVLTNANK